MKERPASESQSWMWQPLPGGGGNEFAGGSCTRRRLAPFAAHFFANHFRAIGSTEGKGWFHRRQPPKLHTQ